MASGSARICLREGIEARDAVAIGQGRPGLALRTETDYLADGQVAQTRAYEGPLPSPTLIDTIDATYDLAGRPDQLKRSTSVLTDFTWNPDGTLASRTDGAIGTTAFQYDWADRLTRANLPDTFSTATPEFTWRADGLIKSRTYGAGTAVSFGYDSAKRLTEIAKGSLTLGQTYDRDGNVTSESRSLGFVGDAGSGTQTFTYDALNRVTGASGLGTSWTYTYDRNGNRKSKADGSTTLTYAYDRTDQLRTVGNGVLADAAFSYNAYGDLTSKVERPSGGAWQTTTHSYDLAGRLTALDGPAAGSGDAATFTFDALGRFRTRALSGSTDTYSYLGTTETVLRIDNSGGGITDSLVDSAGNRLAVKAGSTLNWFLPDPHGNVAAALSSNEATVVNALRYDPWGDLAATGSGGGTAVGATYWKYQGRLDVAPAGTDAGALYDMSARFYSPSLGVFTQLDSVIGNAQDPRSMNRFLYAHANPATLIDPTGHVAIQACSAMADYCPGASGNLYTPKVNKKTRDNRDRVTQRQKTRHLCGRYGECATPRSTTGPRSKASTPAPTGAPAPPPSNLTQRWHELRDEMRANPMAYMRSDLYSWETSCGSYPDACDDGGQANCEDGPIPCAIALIAAVLEMRSPRGRGVPDETGISRHLRRLEADLSAADYSYFKNHLDAGDTFVVGTRRDTAVAREWEGHFTLDVPEEAFSGNLNYALVAEVSKRRLPVYVASPELWPPAAGARSTMVTSQGKLTFFARELSWFQRDFGYIRDGNYLIPPPG